MLQKPEIRADLMGHLARLQTVSLLLVLDVNSNVRKKKCCHTIGEIKVNFAFLRAVTFEGLRNLSSRRTQRSPIHCHASS